MSSIILILIRYLFIYNSLIFLSSFHLISLISIWIFSFLWLMKEKTNCYKYFLHYYSLLIMNFFHYFLMTLSYAEILLWETMIYIFLFIFIHIYLYQIKLFFIEKNCSKFVRIFFFFRIFLF